MSTYRFPDSLGRDKEIQNNIIQFSSYKYTHGGYNIPSGDSSKADTTGKPKGENVDNIFLPISSPPVAHYVPQWAMSAAESSTALSIAGVIQNGSMSDILSRLTTSAITASTEKLLRNQAMNNLATSGTGFKIQPYEENLFNGIGFRSFNFTFKLIPRNATELGRIQDIIKSFKMASLPSIAKYGLGVRIFNSPCVFWIKYIIARGQPSGDSSTYNEHLPKFQPAVCTDVSIQYGGDTRNYVSYAGSRGAPTYFDLSLKFTELTYVTQENAEQGY